MLLLAMKILLLLLLQPLPLLRVLLMQLPRLLLVLHLLVRQQQGVPHLPLLPLRL